MYLNRVFRDSTSANWSWRLFDRHSPSLLVSLLVLLVIGQGCVEPTRRDRGVTGSGGSSGSGTSAITSDDIEEGSSNLFYTDARVATQEDVAANTAARHNAVTLGTANGLQLSGQQLSMQTASLSQSGALSSSDYAAFSAKESAIGSPTTSNNQILTSTSGGTRSWKAVSQVVDPTREVLLWEDWVTNSYIGNLYWTRVVSGTGASVATNNTSVDNLGRPGIATFSTGTTATGRASEHLGLTTVQLAGGEIEVQASVYIPTLSDGTNTYTVRIGLGDQTNNTDFTDGVYFQYLHSTNVNWELKTASNSTRTAQDSGVAVAAGEWIKLGIIVDETASAAEYYINGTLAGTITTNIPVGTARRLTPDIVLAKTVGTTARLFMVDYYLFRQILTNPR